jgi:hypothetical protein
MPPPQTAPRHREHVNVAGDAQRVPVQRRGPGDIAFWVTVRGKQAEDVGLNPRERHGTPARSVPPAAGLPVALHAQRARDDQSIRRGRHLELALIPQRPRAILGEGAVVEAREVLRLFWLGVHVRHNRTRKFVRRYSIKFQFLSRDMSLRRCKRQRPRPYNLRARCPDQIEMSVFLQIRNVSALGSGGGRARSPSVAQRPTGARNCTSSLPGGRQHTRLVEPLSRL